MKGQIVSNILTKKERELAYHKAELPAVVTHEKDLVVNLQVFPNSDQRIFFRKDIKKGTEEGQWKELNGTDHQFE